MKRTTACVLRKHAGNCHRGEVQAGFRRKRACPREWRRDLNSITLCLAQGFRPSPCSRVGFGREFEPEYRSGARIAVYCCKNEKQFAEHIRVRRRTRRRSFLLRRSPRPEHPTCVIHFSDVRHRRAQGHKQNGILLEDLMAGN